ncbi:hypothetical protein D030_1427B, partial [Vibrio parahaemolyticus AQ3810]
VSIMTVRQKWWHSCFT